MTGGQKERGAMIARTKRDRTMPWVAYHRSSMLNETWKTLVLNRRGCGEAYVCGASGQVLGNGRLKIRFRRGAAEGSHEVD